MKRLSSLALAFVLAAPAAAQVETLRFDLPSAQLSIFGLFFSADHLGPPMATIVGARAELTFTTSNLDAADLVVLLQAPSTGVPIWRLRGSDLGWSGTGTFQAQVSTEELNGPIDLGYPVPFASLFLVQVSTQSGARLGGQLEMSAFEVDVEPWTDLGGSLAGSAAQPPQLVGSGRLVAGEQVTFTLSGAPAGATTLMVFGVVRVDIPLQGGVLVPRPTVVVADVVSAQGEHVFGATWPPGLPAGVPLFLQHWILDPAAPRGLAASNGLGGVTPQS